jgi:hypothetical protein
VSDQDESGQVNADRRGAGRLVPDLDDELLFALALAEEVLLTLSAWESDPDDPAALPAPVAGRQALEALNRIQQLSAPTQTRTDSRGAEVAPTVGPARLLGPDARYEHRPLRLVALGQADLDLLAAAAGERGHALAAAPDGELAEALTTGAEAAAGSAGFTPDPVAIVAGLARALGVLDLAVTDDTAMLTARVEAPAGADVVLTATEEAAYTRLADRINTTWADRSGIDRFLY